MPDLYSLAFARLYDLKFTDYARQAAPYLCAFLQKTFSGQPSFGVLDLCCGTGQLVKVLSDQGCQVSGLDLSPAMLDIARKNAPEASFLQGDATSFDLKAPVDAVVSTYDSMNHLEIEGLRGCFASVLRNLKPGGLFLFDLDTRQGLTLWNREESLEEEDARLVVRSRYDAGACQGVMDVEGSVRDEAGNWETVHQTIVCNSHELSAVEKTLRDAGFKDVYFASITDLEKPLADPESTNRVFAVARK